MSNGCIVATQKMKEGACLLSTIDIIQERWMRFKIMKQLGSWCLWKAEAKNEGWDTTKYMQMTTSMVTIEKNAPVFPVSSSEHAMKLLQYLISGFTPACLSRKNWI